MMDASEKMGYCYFLMVVRSESMKPSFHVGDILVSYSIHLDGYCSKQVNDNKIDEVLKIGDVVVLQARNKHIVHRLVEVKCIPLKFSKHNLSEIKEEKDDCLEKIAFMTKGDANKNDDFQMLSSSFNHSCSTIENYALEEHLITNASLIRGKILFSIPKLGLPVIYIKNTYLGKLLLLVCWTVILYNYIK